MTSILLVDDLKSELDLLNDYLTSAGYQVTTASDGKEALSKVIEIKPDAIVTDWMMPNMGGLDLCRQLKKNPDTATIPVVACTAKNAAVDRMWAEKQGVKAYVVKPCTKDQIVDAVKQALV
ncbi:two component signal transduction system twitching motility response regulator PilH [Cyanobacterium sp. HL-69]|uniref:response regulator n=1 Tax=Cyanobacterium sp. HL-69 TaxID=2054282 RepID=UPI000CA3407F|nr:two component signal transduction system twitching motility response regulator PilH [Cyanobacterium sp. HL-69]